MSNEKIAFPERWKPQHPDRIQLYSLATPNGQKIGVALEELALPYEAHRINIMEGDQFDPGFVAINPNSKIPALIDPKGPAGEPIVLMESGAILMYLAEKTGRLLPSDAAGRWQATQWLFFQMASIGPMFGQFGHFYKFAKGKTDDYGEQRYTKEAKRLLEVLNKRLEGRDYLVGDDLSIADIATFPWMLALDYYQAKDALEYDSFANVVSWVERCVARPAVKRGLEVCA
jgi:GST-like protein